MSMVEIQPSDLCNLLCAEGPGGEGILRMARTIVAAQRNGVEIAKIK